jgi:hypothetical protein
LKWYLGPKVPFAEMMDSWSHLRTPLELEGWAMQIQWATKLGSFAKSGLKFFYVNLNISRLLF